MVIAIIGAIGVFLLGMVLLTEGLKSVAGGTLRRGLARFTGNRFSAVATGAAATALVQSSTAIAMTTIGLVAAGLLPMVSAVGVILGANLGTTSTAWIVAYFGLKLDITAFAMIAVAVGASMRLLGRDRVAAIGLPVAGFGLLFVGIGLMQSAMAGLADGINLPGSVDPSLGSLLLLVLIGAAMTIVMQASGAAVAATLTALSVGAIGLEQAAALVIGQNIGTTPKALLASLGATAPARRTALAHVVFNVGTGVVALAILPAFIRLATATTGGGPAPDPAMTIALFHTLFNLIGVAIVLPWIGTYSRLVSHLAPDRGPGLSRFLSRAVAAEGPVAVEAARTALLLCATEIGDAAIILATRAAPAREAQATRSTLQQVQGALDETRTFLEHVRSEPADGADHRRHVSVLHALNHLQGAALLLVRSAPLHRFARAPELGELRAYLRAGLDAMVGWSPLLAPDGPADHVLELLAGVPPLRKRARTRVLRRLAGSETDADDAEATLEALAWAQAFSHHLLRAVHHLREPAPGDEA
jgi:phosphate:Na+ symporter